MAGTAIIELDITTTPKDSFDSGPLRTPLQSPLSPLRESGSVRLKIITALSKQTANMRRDRARSRSSILSLLARPPRLCPTDNLPCVPK